MLMRHACARLSALLLIGAVGVGCEIQAPAEDVDQEALIIDRTIDGTRGFYFLPPIAQNTPRGFSGVFEDDLSPVVRFDRVDSNGQTIANVATLTATAREVRRHPNREFYIARLFASRYNLNPEHNYRLRVLVEDKVLGAADVDVIGSAAELHKVDTRRFVPLTKRGVLPIKFRIERRAADQDGDGVPDWKDNCPTVYNPPTAPGHDPRPSKATPFGCDYNTSDCDPQEVDCRLPHGLKQKDSDGDGIGDACECAAGSCSAPDPCHIATGCANGTCSVAPAPDGTSCSDGNACNGVETCQAGACTAGAAPSCGSNDPCVVGSCDAVDGCRLTPAPDGTSCSLAHAAGTCGAGRCGSPACNAGFKSCDGSDANGCELDVTGDVANCGACGNVCNPTCQRLLFSEDWESGSGAWWTADAGPIVVSSETAPCGGHFQHEAVSFAGGRVFARTAIPTRGGDSYCLTAWARATTDAIPFLGIHLSDAAGNLAAFEHWLIGMDGYPTGYGGDVVTSVTSDGNWHFYSKSFVTEPGDDFIVVKDENFGAGASDFDQIRLFEGPCPSAPATVCSAPAPICVGPRACNAGVCAM
jgi:hypothetical protein